MKHLLIAASVLAMTAGVASADVTFTATANAGIAKNGTANGGSPQVSVSSYSGAPADGKFAVYSDFDLKVSASGTTDSGLTFGATTDIHSGIAYTLGDGDAFKNKSGSLGEPTVFVSGSFGKVSFSANNLSFFNDDATNGGNVNSADIAYEGTFGPISIGVVTDIESTDTAVQVGYTSGPVALSADYNQDSGANCQAIWDASGSYTMGAFTGTLSATNDNNICMVGGYDTSESLKLAYSSAGIGAWVKGTSAYTGSSAEFAIGGSYTSGPMSFTLEVDDVTAANNPVAKWTVTAGYDLGNGLSLTAGANYTNDVMLGASMSF